MRAIFLTTLVVLLAACGSSAVVSEEPAPPSPVTDNLASSRPAPAEGPALVPLGMTVPLVAWNSEQRAYELQLVDPSTGRVFPGRTPIEVGHSPYYPPTVGLSPDGSQLAFVTGVGSACEAYQGCRPAADEVQVIDLLTWGQVTADIAVQFPEARSPLKGWVDPLVFSPGGTRLALAYHNRDGTTAMVFDTQTGQLMGRQTLPVRPRLMEFSADGTQLVIYGSPPAEIPWISQPDPPSVLLLDSGSLEIQWSQFLPDLLEGGWCLENCESPSEVTRSAYWWPAVVFSREREELYIIHADADRLTTVDLQERTVWSQVIGPRPTWIERLLALTADVAEAKGWSEGGTKSAALSQDGTRLYVTGVAWDRSRDANGDWLGTSTPLGLQVIEVTTGHELETLESDATRIRISADRRYLILDWGSSGSIEVVEAETLRVAGHVEDWELLASLRVDGQPVLLAVQASESGPTRLAMVGSKTFEVLSEWSVNGLASWLTAP